MAKDIPLVSADNLTDWLFGKVPQSVDLKHSVASTLDSLNALGKPANGRCEVGSAILQIADSSPRDE